MMNYKLLPTLAILGGPFAVQAQTTYDFLSAYNTQNGSEMTATTTLAEWSFGFDTDDDFTTFDTTPFLDLGQNRLEQDSSNGFPYFGYSNASSTFLFNTGTASKMLIVFTAPETASYEFTASFTKQGNSSGDGASFTATSDELAFTPVIETAPNTKNVTTTLNFTTTLATGERAYITFDGLSSASNDSFRTFQLDAVGTSTIPEPSFYVSALALMSGGLVTLRKRQQKALS